MIDAINPDLKSTIVNQFGKPIVKSGEALHKNTIIVNENTQTHVEQNEEIKASFLNIKKFNQTFEGSGGKFAAGLKELTGGFIDLQDMSETTSKKFKAIGDIGSSLLTPFKAVGSLFEKKTDEEKEEEIEAKKKLKLQKEDNKKTTEKNKQSKGFLGNLKIFSLKFALIAGVAGLVVVGLMKLVKFFSENGALQTVFNFIGNMIGRVQNVFDAVILGINAAAAAVPWYDGFLSQEDIDEINKRMGKRIVDRKINTLRSQDEDRVAEIRAEEEAKGDYKTQAELNRKIDARAAEEGLLTNRMVLLEESEGGGMGIKADDGSYKPVEEVFGTGGGINNRIFEEVNKTTGNEDILKQTLDTMNVDEEVYTDSINDKNERKNIQVKALGIIHGGELEDQQSRVEQYQRTYDQVLANAKGNENDKRVINAKANLDREKNRLNYMLYLLDEFKRIDAEQYGGEGRGAEEVYAGMKMGKNNDSKRGQFGGGEEYRNFGLDDFEREFDEYVGEEDSLTRGTTRSFFSRNSAGHTLKLQADMLKEASDVGVDNLRNKSRREFFQSEGGSRMFSNFSTYVDAKSYSSSEYATVNTDIN